MVNHFIPFELITQNYAEMRAINNSPDAFSAGRNLYQAPIGLPLLQKNKRFGFVLLRNVLGCRSLLFGIHRLFPGIGLRKEQGRQQTHSSQVLLLED